MDIEKSRTYATEDRIELCWSIFFAYFLQLAFSNPKYLMKKENEGL